jgi:DNA (cytosine-5)-methyltransferase 1
VDSRAPVIRTWLGDDEMIADNFAGGGGASTGILAALGRSPDVAINHDPEALAMHAANHPTCDHRVESVWKVDPIAAAAGRPVGLAWFSPDCKHFSKAKGGKPREQRIRGLAWVAVRWAHRVQPRVIVLENVEEFLTWGPLHRQHTHGCTGETRERHIAGRSRETTGCRVTCRLGMPIEGRKGETFRRFASTLEAHGYEVEWRMLRACDFGAPTTRKRLFLIARCDGQPIRWPAVTHAKGGARGLVPFRTAAECIDWSIPCPSIFDRARPLADKTNARIARGIRKFVLEAARPFVIPVNHGGVGRRDHRVHDIDAPMPTVTGGSRGGHAIVTPIMVPATHGDRTDGPDTRSNRADEPLRTIVTRGAPFHVVTPHLVPVGQLELELQAPFVTRTGQTGGAGAYVNAVSDPVTTIVTKAEHLLVSPILVKAKTHGGGGNDAMSPDDPLRTVTASKRGEFAIAVPYLVHRSNGERVGQAPRIYDPAAPLGTVVAQGGKHALCAAFLAKHYGGGYTGPGVPMDEPAATVTTVDHHALVAAHITKFYGTSTGADMDDPLPTVTADGWKLAQVAAFLVRYNGNGDAEPVGAPIGTLTTKPRFGLVTVMIDGEEYVIVDIGMRMLTPRELFRAQGFADDYQIDPRGPNGKPLTKTAQIRMCGNSVSPPAAEAIIRANFQAIAEERAA